MKPTNRFEVRSLDVWGNAVDGYEVNDSHRIATLENFEPDSLTDRQILLRWKKAVGATTISMVEIDGNSDNDVLYINLKADGKPHMTLMRIYE